MIESPEAFRVYLENVRQRREAHRQQKRRTYWQSALETLHEELASAKDEQDEPIATELEAVICSFEQALASSWEPSPTAPTNVPDTGSIPDGTLLDENLDANHAAPQTQDIPSVTANGLVPNLEGTAPLSSDQADQAREQTDQQRENQQGLQEEARRVLAARQNGLQTEIAQYLAAASSASSLGLPSAFAQRVLFFTRQALIYDPNISSRDRQQLDRYLADLMALRTPWPPENLSALTGQDARFWETMAHLYQDGLHASELMEWYTENHTELEEHACVNLLNVAAAVQQKLYRFQEQWRRRDEAVQELYYQIRNAGQTAGFIPALGGVLGEDELCRLAASQASIFEDARAEVTEQRQRASAAVRKEKAITAVVAWEQALEGRGVSADTLEKDRGELCALLAECVAAGVPPTNIKVRTAILDTAPVLLAGQMPFSKFLDAVESERVRRNMDAVEVAPAQVDVADDAVDVLVHALLPFTHGRHIVMLGGKSRPQVARDLQERLECSVTWLDSDRGDKFTKFASKVKKADMVLMLKNFISHDLFYASKEAMASNGKHFVVVPSGYGMKQILFQLNEYASKSQTA